MMIINHWGLSTPNFASSGQKKMNCTVSVPKDVQKPSIDMGLSWARSFVLGFKILESRCAHNK